MLDATSVLCLLGFLGLILLAPAPADAASSLPGGVLLDEQGRQMIPGGFVTITEDKQGAIIYTPADYRRMARMGANFQVVRLALGKLGGWPGLEPDPAYFDQIDAMVRMGKEAGLKTVFKMTVYDIKSFGPDGWDKLWKNENGEQDKVSQAWRRVQERYRAEPAVFGYDLLNEPSRRSGVPYDQCQREDLIPFLRRLIDELQAINPEKWALYQPFLFDDADRKPGVIPFDEMTIPMRRRHVIYAPHTYEGNIDRIAPTLERYAREAAVSDAPLMIPEWGVPTVITADANLVQQANYAKIYQITANEIDKRGLGAIKAWFCGSRMPLRNKNNRNAFTWAIFSDATPVGNVERKFIIDPLARTRPLAVAGRIERYGMNFATREFEMVLHPDAALGATEIFVPADRHYPDGFRLQIGQSLVLACPPAGDALQPARAGDADARAQASRVRWDRDRQHVVIENWVSSPRTLTMRVLPGLGDTTK
ncbi:MAG: cellulase family glycosylhydrolase [bacterium]|nr:cellulase family glycosylhydrolase [bacterium]